MVGERWQRSWYCWATPSSYFSRQGKIFSSNLNADPRRRAGVYVVRAQIPSGSTSRENDEGYKQFNSMLGDAPSVSPQKRDAKSAAYADFADMLGLDASSTEQEDSKKSVAKLSPKKVEIDPADYSLFDAMLERTGGKGKKPTKGGKRYTSYHTYSKKGAKREIVESDLDSQLWNSTDGNDESVMNAPAKPSLTAEEKAQAYAVMMEEFGPGVHDVVEAWSPDEDVDELKPQPTQLLEPPKRPGGGRPAEISADRTITTSEPVATYQETDEEADSLALETKPSRPFSDDQSSQNKTAKNVVSQDDRERTDMSASNPLEKGPLSQFLEGQSRRDQDEPVSNTIEAKAKAQLELEPPPIRSSGVSETENREAVVTEVRREGSAPSRYDGNYKDAPPVALPKPNRPGSVAVTTVSGHSQLDADLDQSRPTSRKKYSRKQRLQPDEPIEILKNPKLVYETNE